MFKKSMMCALILFLLQMQAADNSAVSEERACEDAKKVFIEWCEDADRMSRWAVEFTIRPERCYLAYFAMTAKCMKAQERIVERQRALDNLPHYLD